MKITKRTPALLTVDQVAQLIESTPARVLRLIQQGELPTVSLMTRDELRVPLIDLRRWLVGRPRARAE
jgi:hypothetical protein